MIVKKKQSEQNHLPVMGIGPVCIAIMIAFTAAGIALVKFNMLTKTTPPKK